MEWNYHERGGPAGWGDLKLPGGALAFPDCNGTRQSPIEIPEGTPSNSEGVSVSYGPMPLRVINTGLTIQVDCNEGYSATLAGRTYPLQQFHFHVPGEHGVDGSFSAIELHFVHMSDDGVRAVVAVLIDPGAANAAFQQVLDSIPEAPGTVDRNITFDPRGMLPRSLEHYAYEGSLTMPPCTEGVQWFVLRERLMASVEQIERFRALPFLNPGGRFVGNTRPVQARNGRFE